MKITKYEIDMLDVKAADAILIHFRDDDTNFNYVVLVDAGRYEDGEEVVKFVREKYKTYTIDLAICTHCDEDHFGGFIYILEQMRDHPTTSVDIKKIVINDPGLHITPNDVKYYQKLENVQKEARKVYDSHDVNLLDLIHELEGKNKISMSEGMSDNHCFFLDKAIDILGPSKDYYKQKALLFRNSLQPYDYGVDTDADDAQLIPETNKIFSKTLANAGDDQSPHNQSSIIFLFKPSDGKKFLFTGDAGAEAFNNFYYSCDIGKIKNVFWLKVPHHGSKMNLDNNLINLIHPQCAYVSAESYKHYLSKAVVSALNKAGCKVFSTHKSGPIWHDNGMSDRGTEYVAATAL